MSRKKSQLKRVLRTFSSLITSLSDHLSLLEEDYDRAFIKGEKAKLADVAGRLRMLVFDKGTNKPLLLDLMMEFKSTVKLVVDKPPQLGGMKTVSLPDWLEPRSLRQRLLARFPVLGKPPGKAVVRNHEQRVHLPVGQMGIEGHVFAAKVHVREEPHTDRIFVENAGSGDLVSRGARWNGEAAIRELNVAQRLSTTARG